MIIYHNDICMVIVREKAKELAALVKDKDRVKEERLRARRVSYLMHQLSHSISLYIL